MAIKSGTANNDTVTGTTGGDTLYGFAGNDALFGGDGNDLLVGGLGNDNLVGGIGRDTLVGGLGADILTGGSGGFGGDSFKYNSLAEIGGDKITDLGLGDEIDLSAITGLTFVELGMDFDGTVNQVKILDNYFPKKTLLQIDVDGDRSADYVLALPAHLIIEETAAGSMIFQVALGIALECTNINDSLIGTNGNDRLEGRGGNDSLVGGYGADTLVGGYGADTLVGGGGADTLTGGAGNDVFKYNSLPELSYYSDTITDLMQGDKIDLSAIDANSQQAGDQAFSFLNGNAFSGNGGELYYSAGTLYGDIDGNLSYDFAITLSGFVPHESDFIL